ncbi:MAG: PSD1 and planctomycete cytochrome C domain-containing protein [Bryobacteraceae bacterium]
MFSLLGLLLSTGLGLAQQSSAISFSKDVVPVIQSKCLSCHGQSQQMAGLDLRTRAGMLKGGLRGPALTPGDANASRLYRRISGAEDPAMPLGGSLGNAEVEVFRKWIEQGAPWDAAGEAISAAPLPSTRKITPTDRAWWAFRKPVKPSVPPVKEARWSQNPIDAFIARKLDEKGLMPAPPAGKRTLIRRLYLDVTGLLPTPEETDAFANDNSPDAYEQLVERLLASPHYGERWARHWLDVARYADSGGYEQDFNYPNAWRYRDYVIRAFNEDKPYNRFILEQLAGDELDEVSFDSLIATGFNRVLPTVGFREMANPEYRYTYLDDLVGTTSRAFLGLTVSCARCHDHKFDPILQADYYRMQAFFFPYVRYDHPLASASEVADYEARKAAAEAKMEPLRERIARIEEPYRKLAFEKKLATFPDYIQEAVRTPEEKRTEGQKLLATQVQMIRGGNIRGLLSAQDAAEVSQLQSELRQIQKEMPKPLPVAMGIRDGDDRFRPPGPGDDEAPGIAGSGGENLEGSYIPVPGKPYKPPEAHFLVSGDPDNKGPQVQPGFPEVLSGGAYPTAKPPSDGRITTGRRRALAEWIVSGENPLTARVMVNRVWQLHFGRGIVGTASNFGRLGHRPSHPELLDWLATEFVEHGWSVKHIHRLILSSATYRMASDHSLETNAGKDPDNIYLYRFPQRRLEGEAIRDLILAASGKLNLEAGGPPFFPPVPERVRKSVAKGIWNVTEDGPSVWRRSVYSYYKRGMRYPMFEVFDQPDPNITCEGRNTTTVPTQALTLLNNEFVVTQSEHFARRVESLAGREQDAQIRVAYRIALGREPTAREMEMNLRFLNRQIAGHDGKDAALAALTDLCNVVLNLNEFVYLN